MWVIESNKGPMVQGWLRENFWNKCEMDHLIDGLVTYFDAWGIAISYSRSWESGFRVRHPLAG
jgi:hypothetical protein